MRSTLFFFLFFLSHHSLGGIKTFTTDYCTNFPEGTREHPDLWKDCCLMHDLYFWVGGARQDRKNSDLELKTCIEKSGAIKQSRIMYLAVRAGSYSPIKYPKLKWNNGWDDERPIRALSAQDLELIEEELSSGYDFISEDLKQSFLHSLRSRAE